MPTEHTTHKCKKMVSQWLKELGLGDHKLTARTIGFADLARDSCVFVKVHDWEPDTRGQDLKKLARAEGFRVEFAGKPGKPLISG